MLTIFVPIKTNEPALVVCTLRESFSPDLFSLPVLVNLGQCCCICILQCEVPNLSLSFPINLPCENRHWHSTEKQGIILKTQSILMSQRTIQWENICAQGLPHQFLFIQMKHVLSFIFFHLKISFVLTMEIFTLSLNEAQTTMLVAIVCLYFPHYVLTERFK